jgi:hypothetical protein
MAFYGNPSMSLDQRPWVRRDIMKLFNSEKFSDVKIVCGNKTLFAHKNILATSSDVFAAMFDTMTGSNEVEKGVVQVDDFDARTIKSLLEFIYGIKILVYNCNIDLVLAGFKYNVPNLVKGCERNMHMHVSSFFKNANRQNTFEILVSSRLISEKLYNAAKRVIQEEGVCQVDFKSNQSYKKMKVEDPELSLELLEDCIATKPDWLSSPYLEFSEDYIAAKPDCLSPPYYYTTKMSQNTNDKDPLVWDNSSPYFQDMVKLFTSGKFSDVKIVCGNKTFLCHKNILASRSDVFAAMFDITSATENQKRVVQVDDFDAKTMKTLLGYIYCNNIAREDGDMGLLLAADKYNLPGLVECCKRSIISEWSLNEALEALMSSQFISSKNIVDVAKRVIRKQDADDIISNHSWKKLKVENSELAMELLEDYIARNVPYVPNSD